MPALKKFLRSFRYAWRGLVITFREEQSFRIQLAAAAAVTILALIFRVKAWEAVALTLVAVSVLVLELLNSVIERLVDAAKPRLHVAVGAIKDITAAAVFISSLSAAVIGLIIFYPYFAALLK